MTAKKISELSSASALSGAEALPIVQSGTTKKVTAQEIADLAKPYTDAKVAGLSWKQAVRAATTAPATLSSSFENGDTLDGVTLATGDRILVKDQGAPAENGIYVVAASGAPSRAADADSSAELVNASVYVSEGTTHADTQWTCTANAPITIGSTAINFAQLTSAGASDAADVTYTPATAANWNGSADPGDVDDALDQLAARTNALESAGGGSTGKQLIPVMASAMTPRQTGGCANHAWLVGGVNQPDVPYLAFDPNNAEGALFAIAMPKSWNEGTLTFEAVWAHPATTTNFGVAWYLRAVAVSDGDALAATFGTAVAVTDTGGTTDTHYMTSESGAITVAGTPAAKDTVFFEVGRDPSNGSDNMAVDAYLIGVRVYFTTDAGNEA